MRLRRLLRRCRSRGALPVLVEWVDCHAHSGSWESTAELVAASQPRSIRSVGWLLPDILAAHLTIAQDQDEDNGCWHGVSHIPTACVVDVEWLR